MYVDSLYNFIFEHAYLFVNDQRWGGSIVIFIIFICRCLEFVSRQTAQEQLLSKPIGTFLIRFSDGVIGAVSIAWCGDAWRNGKIISKNFLMHYVWTKNTPYTQEVKILCNEAFLSVLQSIFVQWFSSKGRKTVL